VWCVRDLLVALLNHPPPAEKECESVTLCDDLTPKPEHQLQKWAGAETKRVKQGTPRRRAKQGTTRRRARPTTLATPSGRPRRHHARRSTLACHRPTRHTTPLTPRGASIRRRLRALPTLTLSGPGTWQVVALTCSLLLCKQGTHPARR